MKIKYYGTAAAEGFPGMFCECETCKRARLSGGKSIRTRSQTAIDDTLLLDLGPDTYHHVITGGLDLTKIKAVLITHSHFDHFSPDILRCISQGKAERENNKTLEIFGGEDAFRKTSELAAEVNTDSDVRLVPRFVMPNVEFKADKYTVFPLSAFHDENSSPVNYIISDGKKTVLYAHDTGMYDNRTIERISQYATHIDLVSMDCTYGARRDADCDHHMSVWANIQLKNMLISNGICDDKTIFVANHFSHFCKNIHEEMCEITKEYGIIVSFDNLEIGMT